MVYFIRKHSSFHNMALCFVTLYAYLRRPCIAGGKSYAAPHQLAFSITFIFSLFAYLNTVSPSIAGGDSGELVSEGCNLGTSHPPGYPLYTIIVFFVTKFGTLLFPNARSKAWMVNVTSCIFGSIASSLLASSVALLLRGKTNHNVNSCSNICRQSRASPKKNKALMEQRENFKSDVIHVTAATTVGLLHSFSPLVWQYSTTAEVFALNNLFVALLVHASICFALERSLKYYLRGAFVCGMALTHQHTSILLSVPMIAWVFYTTGLYNPRRWGVTLNNGKRCNLITLAACSFLSSFVMLYATLPLFAMLYPHAGSWGNVKSVVGFINHFRRKDYGTLQLFSGNDNESEDCMQRTFLWAKDFVCDQGSPFLAVCFVIGCAEALTREYKRWSGKKQFRSGRPARNDRRKSERKTALDSIFHFQGPGIEMAIFYALVFYLLVFHSLANLPLNNQLYFGIHQVSLLVGRLLLHLSFIN